MLDSKAWVYGLLKNNTALTTALGSSDRIQYMYPNTFNTLPVVTYQEINNRNVEFYDNAAFADEITIQVGVWANTSTTALAKLVDAVFAANLFTRDFSSDVPEPDAKIYHRVMRFHRVINADDLDAN